MAWRVLRVCKQTKKHKTMKILSTKRYAELRREAGNAEAYAERFREKCEEVKRLEAENKGLSQDLAEARYYLAKKVKEIEKLKSAKVGERDVAKPKSAKGGKKSEKADKGGKKSEKGDKNVGKKGDRK